MHDPTFVSLPRAGPGAAGALALPRPAAPRAGRRGPRRRRLAGRHGGAPDVHRVLAPRRARRERGGPAPPRSPRSAATSRSSRSGSPSPRRTSRRSRPTSRRSSRPPTTAHGRGDGREGLRAGPPAPGSTTSPTRPAWRRRTAAIRALGGERVRSGRYRVVLGPQPVTDLLNNLVLPALHASSFYASTTPFLGRFGQRVAAPTLSIYDHGALPGLTGSKGITCEGLPTGRTDLVSDGILTGLLTNWYEAQRLLRDPQARAKLGVDPGEAAQRARRRETASASPPAAGGASRRRPAPPRPTSSWRAATACRSTSSAGGWVTGSTWAASGTRTRSTGSRPATSPAPSSATPTLIRDGRIAVPLKANAVRISDNITSVLEGVLGVTQRGQGHDGLGRRRSRLRPVHRRRRSPGRRDRRLRRDAVGAAQAHGRDAGRPPAPARGPPGRVSRRDRGDDSHRGRGERPRLRCRRDRRHDRPRRRDADRDRRRSRHAAPRAGALPRHRGHDQDPGAGHRLRRGRDQARPPGLRGGRDRDPPGRRSRRHDLGPHLPAAGALAMDSRRPGSSPAGEPAFGSGSRTRSRPSSTRATSRPRSTGTSGHCSIPPSSRSWPRTIRAESPSRSTAPGSRRRPCARRSPRPSRSGWRGSGSRRRRATSSATACPCRKTNAAWRSARSAR